MKLHLELFVSDLAASRSFYARVLGFHIHVQKPDGYTVMIRGDAIIALNSRTILREGHPARAQPGEGHGRGVEIVLSVDDVERTYEVCGTGWPVSTPLTRQPWGAHDFRVVDPDGYYINVSGPEDGLYDGPLGA